MVPRRIAARSSAISPPLLRRPRGQNRQPQRQGLERLGAEEEGRLGRGLERARRWRDGRSKDAEALPYDD
eukprot:7473233-Pyramimonas_sp.AAC.1